MLISKASGKRQNHLLCRSLRFGFTAIVIGLFFLFGGTVISPAGGLLPLPKASKIPVSDEYHGVQINEDYRWLEDYSDPKVQKWTQAQDQYTRSRLMTMPQRENIYNYIERLYGESSPEYYYFQKQAGVFFAFKKQPRAEQPQLVSLGSLHDTSTEKIVLDPNQLDPEGETTIDFYVPSPDGRLVAVSLSRQGSEIGTLFVYEVASGRRLPDSIPRVNGPTAGGSAAWRGDGSGFFYTRYPRPGERPPEDLHFYQQIYYHKLGTLTGEDIYSAGKQFPRIAEVELEASGDGRYILATVANGDGGEYNHYLLGPAGEWTQITEFSDKITGARFSPGGYLYMLSHQVAPRGKIIRLPLEVLILRDAETIVPENEVVIKDFEPTENYLYVVDLIGGPSQARIFSLEGVPIDSIPAVPVSNIWGLEGIGGDQVMFNNESYVDPPAWYLYDPESKEATRTALNLTSPARFGDMEVKRVFARSKDGTRVPLNIMFPEGIELDGNNPALLTGYGGFGISQTPGFSPDLRLWFDQGGVYAIANLRGGGEYGEEWHLAGNLTNKQNVFDDFIACAEYLIDSGYTNPRKLAIKGGSNGGLLMGAVMTQRPDLFQAVVASRGIYDMVRYVQDPNGIFNIPEYGSVADEEQFRAIYAYSPYHNVRNGIDYPSALFIAGQQDGRVKAYQSRKMVARLQEAVSDPSKILLRFSTTTGHGDLSLTEKTARRADTYAFIIDKLDVDFTPYVLDVEGNLSPEKGERK